jgi:cytochrome c peroxidase
MAAFSKVGSAVCCALLLVPGARADVVAVGRQIFFDPSLSASGRQACASCHSPTHAYGPPNGLAVQLGGAALNRQGARAVMTLRYALNRTPVWSFHTLRDALRFYVQRDTDPQLWYPAEKNVVVKFDDLPAASRGNVDVTDLPLTLGKGAQPIWNAAEIDDVIAFLKTLSDEDTQ